MCEKCGKVYSQKPEQNELKTKIDLSHVKTPEELLAILTSGMAITSQMEPCMCGMSEVEFDKKGKMGCPKCYDHFYSKLEQLVFPYHGASQHVGKQPKSQLSSEDPEQMEKLLKLQLSEAVELEEYERAAEIKSQLQSLLTQSSIF
jgi:protein arginine kinase activator